MTVDNVKVVGRRRARVMSVSPGYFRGYTLPASDMLTSYQRSMSMRAVAWLFVRNLRFAS